MRAACPRRGLDRVRVRPGTFHRRGVLGLCEPLSVRRDADAGRRIRNAGLLRLPLLAAGGRGLRAAPHPGKRCRARTLRPPGPLDGGRTAAWMGADGISMARPRLRRNGYASGRLCPGHRRLRALAHCSGMRGPRAARCDRAVPGPAARLARGSACGRRSPAHRRLDPTLRPPRDREPAAGKRRTGNQVRSGTLRAHVHGLRAAGLGEPREADRASRDGTAPVPGPHRPGAGGRARGDRKAQRRRPPSWRSLPDRAGAVFQFGGQPRRLPAADLQQVAPGAVRGVHPARLRLDRERAADPDVGVHPRRHRASAPGGRGAENCGQHLLRGCVRRGTHRPAARSDPARQRQQHGVVRRHPRAGPAPADGPHALP